MSTTKVEAAKDETITERRAKLRLPEQHPVASDWQSAGASNVNAGSESVESDFTYGNAGREGGLKGTATADRSARVDGEDWRRSTPPQVGKSGEKKRQRKGESKEIGMLIDIGNSEGNGR